VKAAKPLKSANPAKPQPSRKLHRRRRSRLSGIRGAPPQLDLSLEELSVRLGLTRATIEKRKATGRLTPDESGKVVCFARLLGHAVHLFGDLKAARRWLKEPQRILHGAVPLDYAKTDLGAREVEYLLTQLDYGIKA
jgi:putative toxin-antitoxin system antitoxin component (TIGR02293 family)